MWSWQISGWRDSWQTPRSRGTHLLAHLSGWLRRSSNSQRMISRWAYGHAKEHPPVVLWGFLSFYTFALKHFSPQWLKSSPWSDNVLILVSLIGRLYVFISSRAERITYFSFLPLFVNGTHLTDTCHFPVRPIYGPWELLPLSWLKGNPPTRTCTQWGFFSSSPRTLHQHSRDLTASPSKSLWRLV